MEKYKLKEILIIWFINAVFIAFGLTVIGLLWKLVEAFPILGILIPLVLVISLVITLIYLRKGEWK